MKKLGTFALVAAAAAGILSAGAGLATADDQTSAQPVVAVGEQDPTGATGSSAIVSNLVKALSSGSANGTTK
ncbi:hypothetical protein AB0N05_36905 [Nocardia sp. NPDC051030]|uniref:hypothetical protein n=1 Tax=Nocardia sp. NPDC051030 TaxID=3155162 RepID=UPI0034358CC7